LSVAQALWFASLLLAGLSLAIMCGLLIARSVSRYLTTRRETERNRLVALLLGQSGLPTDAALLRGIGRKLQADLSVELIQLVRGEDRERFIASATKLGVPKRLRHKLDSGSPRVRLSAAEALAQFPDEESQQRLRFALQDSSPDVRIAAALSLADAGQPPPAAELVYKLGIGTRENSLLAVSLFRDVAEQRPDEVKALLLDENIPAGAKAALIESLAASVDYTLVPLIVSLASQEENPQHLTRYLRALGKFGHPAAEPAIKRAFQSEHWEVRAAAAGAAGRIGLEALAPNLKQLLGDPEWWVRFRAGEALARLGSRGIAHLREVASSDADPAATAASKIIAERGLE
jgi:HEAT repeat protein